MAYNPTFKINLNSVFNSAFSSKSSSEKRQLKSIIKTNDFKRDYKNRIMRTIRDNTRNKSRDKDGRPLSKYSKSYKESETFQVLKGSSKVDLTLSGEMLESIEGISRGDSIVFQFKGTRNKDIAHGHINGSNNLPVRDFFGIKDKEQQSILKEIVKFYASRNEIFENSNITPTSTRQSSSQVQTNRPQSSLTDDVFGALEVGLFDET